MLKFFQKWSGPSDKRPSVGNKIPDFFPVPPDRLVIHATHPKAGSQWIQAIFSDLFGPAAVPNRAGNGTPTDGQFNNGRIYLSVYLLPTEIARHAAAPDAYTPFFVMRDLRDTLVSLYFSLKVSHEILDEFMASARKRLLQLNEEDGLIYLIESQLQNSAKLQKLWLQSHPGRCVKFESLTMDPDREMARVINQMLGLNIPEESIRLSCQKFAFEKLAGGRQRGEEDAKSHFRSGAAGSWRKHFTPAVTEAFKDEFPRLLQDAGYESDDHWQGMQTELRRE
jgi:hypothetical protein